MNAEASQVILAESRTAKRDAPLTVAATETAALMQIIANAARDPEVDADKMLKLFDMREREFARLARQAFAAAMAEFKANPPKIVKDKHVSFDTSKGRTEYDHATLGHVCDQIIEGLAAVGISHRWDLEQHDGGMTTVTCVLTHREGHETRTPLKAGRDDTGSKNNIQSMGSSVTYLQRYTLLAATGLAAGLPDNDGRGAENDYERITDSQVADLKALCEEVGANVSALLTYIRVEKLSDISVENYPRVVKLVEEKRKRPATGAGARR